MLEKVLQHHKLGNQVQILYVLELLSKGAFPIDELNKACISKEYSFSSSFRGVICLLQWLGVVKINELVYLKKSIGEESFVEKFCELLFSKMALENELHNFINSKNLIFTNPSEPIFVKNNLIKLKFSPVRNFLISLNVFVRDDFIYNQFVIHKDFSQWFATIVVPLIEESRIKNRTLQDFKKSQSIISRLGAEAEKFVLNFEREKRANHPNRQNIKIISEIDVGAGYDIQSYKDENSVFIDKLIEVKSYKGAPSFYWSNNEIEVARKEKDNYFLFLVDREKMGSSRYEPIMIQNPSKNLLEDKKWKRICQNWKFEK